MDLSRFVLVQLFSTFAIALADEWSILPQPTESKPPAISIEWQILDTPAEPMPPPPAMLDWSILSVGATDAAGKGTPPAGTDAQASARQKRIDEYQKCRERAEKIGASTYYSDGKDGTALPVGSYQLIRLKDGSVWYREEKKMIPKPDNDCPT